MKKYVFLFDLLALMIFPGCFYRVLLQAHLLVPESFLSFLPIPVPVPVQVPLHVLDHQRHQA